MLNDKKYAYSDWGWMIKNERIRIQVFKKLMLNDKKCAYSDWGMLNDKKCAYSDSSLQEINQSNQNQQPLLNNEW